MISSPGASDRAGHPALPVRLVGDALPAAEAGGGGTLAPASRRPVLARIRGLHLFVVRSGGSGGSVAVCLHRFPALPGG